MEIRLREKKMRGLLEAFGIVLGEDLQKSSEMKEPLAAFYTGLLVLNEIANSENTHLPLWTQLGLQAFAETKTR